MEYLLWTLGKAFVSFFGTYNLLKGTDEIHNWRPEEGTKPIIEAGLKICFYGISLAFLAYLAGMGHVMMLLG